MTTITKIIIVKNVYRSAFFNLFINVCQFTVYFVQISHVIDNVVVTENNYLFSVTVPVFMGAKFLQSLK